jgi:small subunit ribosomal protein S18
MARNNDRDRSTKRAAKDTGRRTKPKVCIFCKDGIDHVDYKDVSLLRKFMNDRGKIRARQATGNCQQHQRDVAVAIKTAREFALVPYTQRTTMTERPGGRGSGRGRRGPGTGESRGVAEAEVGEAPVEVAFDADTDAVPTEEPAAAAAI